jgi:ABC-type transport system involved in multi-copper enzyme maturation permease subunit
VSTTYAGSHGKGLSFPRILRSEWIKLRTLRSTWISYTVALIIAIGLSAAISFGHGHEVHQHPGEPVEAVAPALAASLLLGQLVVGVLGVMSITGEYATGMIRASASAVPKRTPFLLGKAVVFGLATAVVSLVMTFGAFFMGQLVLSQWHLDTTLSSPGALRAVLAAAFYITVIGLIGLGLGFAIRNTGGAIAALFGIVFVLLLIGSFLPSSWSNHFTKYVPLHIGLDLITTESGSTSLSPSTGIVLLAVYALAALTLGWAVLKRRDV